MTINASFNGTTYPLPQEGEVGWASLTNYLVALANYAATNTSGKQNIRIATTTPVNLSATDYTVVSKLTVPGAVTMQLPAGSPGRVIVIADGTGDAATNNVTVTPFSGETINADSSLVIKRNFGSVYLQFNGGDWITIASFTKDIITGDIVGTSDSQTITNKNIDLGTASNSQKITVSKNTKANLDALTRKQGTVYYATDDALLYADDGFNLQAIGGNFAISNQTKSDGQTINFDPVKGLQVVIVSAAFPVTVLLATTPTVPVQATIRGTSDVNTIAINYSSTQRINGPVELGADDHITVLFDTATSSWVEIGRNK